MDQSKKKANRKGKREIRGKSTYPNPKVLSSQLLKSAKHMEAKLVSINKNDNNQSKATPIPIKQH